MFEKRKLTGKQRHRTHKPLFGKPMLVLQVEIEVSGAEYGGAGPPDFWPVHTIWVDAQPEHLVFTDYIYFDRASAKKHRLIKHVE